MTPHLGTMSPIKSESLRRGEGLKKPEDWLLYLCAFPSGDSVEHEELIQLTSAVKDWDGLLERASHHRLPLRLYLFLKQNDAPFFLTPHVWQRVETAARLAQFHVMAHEAELGRLLPLFGQARIDILLMKGAALLQNVYQKKAVRYLVDLDLLIHRKDLARTLPLLEELGYQSQLGHFPSRWHEKIIYSHLDQAYFPFSHPIQKLHLDLHVEAFEAPLLFNLRPDWLWEGAERVRLHGSQTFLPDPSRLFLHLLLHLVKHREARQNVLGWYLDLDECLRYFGDRIDGRFLWEIIQTSPETDKILEVLAFIRTHFSSTLPFELQSLLEERGVRSLSLDSVLEPPAVSELDSFNGAQGMNRRELFLFYWGLVPGLRKKLWFLLRWFFPDPRYLKTKYRFGNLRERLLAYGRHLKIMGLKGASLAIYLLRKNRYT